MLLQQNTVLRVVSTFELIIPTDYLIRLSDQNLSLKDGFEPIEESVAASARTVTSCVHVNALIFLKKNLF